MEHQKIAAEKLTQFRAYSLNAAEAFIPGTRVPAANLGVLALTSEAAAGLGVSEELTVTGLLATDVVLAVTAVQGNTALIAFDPPTAGKLAVSWTGAPGVGAKVRVLVAR